MGLKNTGKKLRKPIMYGVCEKGIECIVETFEEVLNIVMFLNPIKSIEQTVSHLLR